MRLAKLQECPLCERCYERGIITPAEDVHHIESLSDAPSLAYKYYNLMSLCKECHGTIHAEKQREENEELY